MNNKILLKTGWLLISVLVIYLLFVVFFLFPRVNSYLINNQIEKERIQFKKVVSIINTKSQKIQSKDLLFDEVKQLLNSLTLVKSNHFYIFDKTGIVLVDLANDFPSKNISKTHISSMDKNNIFNSIKKSYKLNQPLNYKWNKPYDFQNYIYEKVLWVDYNDKFDFYIASSVYLDDYNDHINGINSLILNISMLLFILLLVIGGFISYRIIVPINKILKSVQNIKSKSFKDSDKDEISILSSQFNSLLNQVENNRKIIETHVDEKTKEIASKLYWDEITNLKNRYALEDEIKDYDFVSVALVDIDSFDDINELYGFSAGNVVLREVGRILKDFSFKYKFDVYRIYGNSFAVVDKNMMLFSEYENFVKELSSLFKNKGIHLDEFTTEIFVDITIGISLAQDESLKTASIALKKAKQSNKKIFAYNSELDTKEIIKKSNYWREKIKKAIKEDSIIPFYQPIVSCNGDIIKYETLMRIEDIDEEGNKKYISPFEFFEIAIKTKQYAQLSKIIVTKALNDLEKRIKKEVTINLSFIDIIDLDFIEYLDRKLNFLTNKDKSRLVFEILESDYISDYTVLEDFVMKYRKQGIKIAIDDFGTGYSNFSHIIKIKPDYIKIDGSLIKNIHTDKNSYELVKSIVEFSKALKINTIAEFVHCKEVFEIVNDLGIDSFQGYYFGKPELLD